MAHLDAIEGRGVGGDAQQQPGMVAAVADEVPVSVPSTTTTSRSCACISKAWTVLLWARFLLGLLVLPFSYMWSFAGWFVDSMRQRSFFGYRSRILCCACRGGQPGRRKWDNDIVAGFAWIGVTALVAWYVYDLSQRKVEIPWTTYYVWDPIGRAVGLAVTETTSVWVGKPIYTYCIGSTLGGYAQGFLSGFLRRDHSKIARWIDVFNTLAGSAGVTGGVAVYCVHQFREILEIAAGILYTVSLLIGMNTGRFWRFMFCCESAEPRADEPVGVEHGQDEKSKALVVYSPPQDPVDAALDAAAGVYDKAKEELAFGAALGLATAVGQIATALDKRLSTPLHQPVPSIVPDAPRRPNTRSRAKARVVPFALSGDE
jgi:hypothetical protein